MKREVFIVSDNITSPLGSSTEENFNALLEGKSGIMRHERPEYSPTPFYASLFNDEKGSNGLDHQFTKFERLLIKSISSALSGSDVDVKSFETVLIISSTKGNISMLEESERNEDLNNRIALHTSAKLIAGYFGNPNQPIIISNACISGLAALIIGKRLIESGQYHHAVVAGADVISRFVLSGFQSFQAVSDQPCRPFDADRNGISLGEAAGTVILSKNKKSDSVQIAGGSVSNDANHISGPSRTGNELSIAVKKSMKEAGVSADDIAFVCAHGTATIYNDEMEAKAFSLSGLSKIPVNSLKGYYGHTLGAAGIIESIISVKSLQADTIIPTAGFNNIGVSAKVNVCSSIQKVKTSGCVKTASGFGGCNASIVLKKSYS